MHSVSSLAEPAYHSAPEYHHTLGPAVVELCAEAQFAPDPEQAAIHDELFGRDARNRSVAFETAVIAGRQNLKTGLAKQAALAWLFLVEEPLVVWSAQEWDTVKRAWEDMDLLIGSSDWLRRHVRRAPMHESFDLKSGSKLIFKTRAGARGGRGLSANKIILDEALYLLWQHLGGLIPTLSAMPDPQLLDLSSAGVATSDVLRAIRDRGRAGSSARLSYWEWCAPPPESACGLGVECSHRIGTPGCGFDNPKMLRRGNPAYGRRLLPETIAAERDSMTGDAAGIAEYGRERMGWWDEPAVGEPGISVFAWGNSADANAARPESLAFGLSVAPDLSSAVIAVAGRRSDGRTHVEIVDVLQGTGRLVGRVVELAKRWKPVALGVNNAGAASSFLLPLAENGFKTEPKSGEWQLQPLGGRDYAQACMGFAGDVLEDRLRHTGQTPLTDAASAARRRPLGEGWAFAGGIGIVPLEAATVARHAFATFAAQPAPPAPFFFYS